MIIEDTIFQRSNHTGCLVIVHREKLWLPSQWLNILHNCWDFLSLYIYRKETVLLGEDYFIWVFSWRFGVLEVELHRYLGKHRDVFDDDSLDQLKLIDFERVWISHSLENEQLIWLLLIHDKVFTWDNCEHLLGTWHLHRNNFLSFPFIVCE